MSEANKLLLPCCTEDGGRPPKPPFRRRLQTTRRESGVNHVVEIAVVFKGFARSFVFLGI